MYGFIVYLVPNVIDYAHIILNTYINKKYVQYYICSIPYSIYDLSIVIVSNQIRQYFEISSLHLDRSHNPCNKEAYKIDYIYPYQDFQ